MSVKCELTEDGERIAVWFETNEDYDAAINGVSGRRKHRGGKYWTVPAEMTAARELREAFGTALQLGPAVRAWGRREKTRLESLQALSGHSAGLSGSGSVPDEWGRIAETAPDLANALWIGPRAAGLDPSVWGTEAGRCGPSFQVDDVLYMIRSTAPLNANHMGLGKTPETIAAIVGSGLDDGPVLVVAPVSAAEGTWPSELAHWLPQASVFVARGSAKNRRIAYEECELLEDSWLIINPAQLTIRRHIEACDHHQDCKKALSKVAIDTMKRCPECVYEENPANPELFDIEFSAIIFDEAHEHGILGGLKTQTGLGTHRLKLRPGGKRILLSGTPLGGKAEKLFSILQFLNPTVFTSKWRFAENYLEIITKTIGYRNVQTFTSIGGVKRCDRHRAMGIRPVPGECVECDRLQAKMFKALDAYMLRRTKADVLKELPPKMYNEIVVGFASERHQKQYEDFAADGMVEEGDDAVIATNAISEYVRLTQMSFGTWDIKNWCPTADSPKLNALKDKLQELGIFDKEQTSQAVVFSQFKTIVDLVAEELEKAGAAVGKLTGDTKGQERARLKEEFQGEDGVRVLVVCTQAGGTSLTLDRASDVFFLDRMWNPDRDEQAEDRCHRASRIHQVTIHRITTANTIDEYRAGVADSKMDTNQRLMDLRRYLKGE